MSKSKGFEYTDLAIYCLILQSPSLGMAQDAL
ncbi:hypothetical protein E5S67_00451 [Microcoleus sp. IPMA8]|uniref:Transcriptional regulator n=1 Tax=Microcoleus asticus IPMA8 TaxID=2563858 RepID=A0ABX2CTB7_9CYAN|nr:hypothetical protein [Microcoleus asticus IPMA8]